MKSSLDKDDPTTDYLCKGEAEIGPSKEGECVQDVEKNHMRSKNVLQRKLSVTIANEKDTMDPNASLKICRKLQQLSLMQKEAFGILHFWTRYLIVERKHGLSPLWLTISMLNSNLIPVQRSLPFRKKPSNS